MKTPSFLESLEDRFVFRMSRGVFIVVTSLAALMLVGALIYLIWSVTPAAREHVARVGDPSPVVVGADDIKQVFSRTNGVAEQPSLADAGSSENPGGETQRSEAEKKVDALVDTLHQLMPEPAYAWGDVMGKLDDFMREVEPESSLVTAGILEQLCGTLRGFPADQRAEPLKEFITLYTERHRAYAAQKQKVDAAFTEKSDAAEAAYAEKEMAKVMGLTQSAIMIASAIATLGFFAIGLVLLAILRTLRSIAQTGNMAKESESNEVPVS